MSTTVPPETARAVAISFCKQVDARRFDLVAEMFSEDAQWWVVANKDRADWGGSVNAKLRAKWAGELLAPFTEWSYKVLSITAEDDRVIVEGLSRGRGPGVVEYNNNYLMKFTIRDSKVVDFKECMDCYEVEGWFRSREKQAEIDGEGTR